MIDELTVELERKHYREVGITITSKEFVAKAASRFLSWAAQNNNFKRLDFELYSRTSFASLKVAPHGLIGQTFDGDGVAVDGAVDNYSPAVVTTAAMGEGAIEGFANEYEID